MTGDEFEAAQALWEKNGPASYDMDIEIKGAQPGKVHIEVRDETPTAMTRDGIAPAERGPGMPGRSRACFKRWIESLRWRDDPNHEGPGRAGGASVGCAASSIRSLAFRGRYQRSDDGWRPRGFLARQRIRAEVSTRSSIRTDRSAI